jgi:predicted XRE-type DNA-binding protein
MVGLPRVFSNQLKQEHIASLVRASVAISRISKLLTPEAKGDHLYLKAMLPLDRIADEIIESLVDKSTSSHTRQERLSYLDFRLVNLRADLCPEGESTEQAASNPTQKPAQLFIMLRLNHLRLLTCFQSLSSASLALTESKSAIASVNAAEESVRICRQAKDQGFVPAVLTATFTHFLMAAVSTLLLAAIHNRPDLMPVNRRIFDDGLQLLEGVQPPPSGRQSSNQYSIINLRRLAEKIQPVSAPAAMEPQYGPDVPIALEKSSSAVQHPPIEMGEAFADGWDTLQDDPFNAGDLEILAGLVDQTWFHTAFPTSEFGHASSGGGIAQ